MMEHKKKDEKVSVVSPYPAKTKEKKNTFGDGEDMHGFLGAAAKRRGYSVSSG